MCSEVWVVSSLWTTLILSFVNNLLCSIKTNLYKWKKLTRTYFWIRRQKNLWLDFLKYCLVSTMFIIRTWVQSAVFRTLSRYASGDRGLTGRLHALNYWLRAAPSVHTGVCARVCLHVCIFVCLLLTIYMLKTRIMKLEIHRCVDVIVCITALGSVMWSLALCCTLSSLCFLNLAFCFSAPEQTCRNLQLRYISRTVTWLPTFYRHGLDIWFWVSPASSTKCIKILIYFKIFSPSLAL